MPNGDSTVDECGVCGGDGSICADCAGVPNGGSSVDECGVCDGDGSACLCEDQDISSTLAVLDNNARAQAAHVNSAANRVQQLSKELGRKLISNSRLNKFRTRADGLHLSTWAIASDDIPSISSQNCGVLVLNCISVSTAPFADEIRSNSRQLLKIIKKIKRLLKRRGVRKDGKFNLFVRRVRGLDRLTDTEINEKLPTVVTDCQGGQQLE